MPRAIENGSVGIVGFLDRHFVLRDFSGLRVELSYISAKVCGEPDVAFVIGNQSVRASVFSGDGIFFEILRRWVEAANFVGHLLREPQLAVLANRRVMRMRALSGYIPLADSRVEIAHGGSGCPYCHR